MSNDARFHAGERAVQQCAGQAATAERKIEVLTGTVISGARSFIAKQYMVVFSSIDSSGAVWSSVIFGKPGFLHTECGRTISIEVPEKERDASDPLWTNIRTNPDLGMLLIELGSRRRYRANGTLKSLNEDSAVVIIHEAYLNCPKYIQRRFLRQIGATRLPVQCGVGINLAGAVEKIIFQADTVFVASRHAEGSADASHRGGAPGFVHVIDDRTLRIPDYLGNSLFNTLENFKVDPRAGLCIIDFDNGQMLQLTGTVEILWDVDDPCDDTGGTKRYWEFKTSKWILRDSPQSLKWDFLDASPFNLPVHQ